MNCAAFQDNPAKFGNNPAKIMDNSAKFSNIPAELKRNPAKMGVYYAILNILKTDQGLCLRKKEENQWLSSFLLLTVNFNGIC
jgi:hypothetical protein